MTDGIDDEVLERLEAEAKVADAEAEELTIAVESELEEKESEVEELQAEVEEKESEVEELQAEVEEKEERIESLTDDIDAVADDYAEELAKDSDVLDKDDFLDNFDFDELQAKYNELEDASPNPNSGDAGAGFQSGGEGGDEGPEDEADLTEDEELAASQFKRRAQKTGKQYWAEIAEDIEESE